MSFCNALEPTCRTLAARSGLKRQALILIETIGRIGLALGVLGSRLLAIATGVTFGEAPFPAGFAPCFWAAKRPARRRTTGQRPAR